MNVSLKFRHKAPPTVGRFEQGAFKHGFGGPPQHQGAVPRKKNVPMHLLLNLDLQDPLVPVGDDNSGLKALPLYYPLRYDFGGGEVQYSVDNDEKITILSPLHKAGLDGGEEYPFPDQFPERPLTLVSLNYRQYRAIISSDMGGNWFKNDPDEAADFQLRKEINYWQMMRLGGCFSPIQGDIKWKCCNRRCEFRKQNVRVDTFASFTGTLSEEISIWDQYGSDVEIYFGLTSCCKTIVAVNRCT